MISQSRVSVCIEATLFVCLSQHTAWTRHLAQIADRHDWDCFLKRTSHLCEEILDQYGCLYNFKARLTVCLSPHIVFLNNNLITPRMHAQQLVLSVVNTKITRSRDLGIWATRMHNKSVNIIEKLAPLCFKSSAKAHERRKTGVFIGHAYQLHPLCFLLMHTT